VTEFAPRYEYLWEDCVCYKCSTKLPPHDLCVANLVADDDDEMDIGDDDEAGPPAPANLPLIVRSIFPSTALDVQTSRLFVPPKNSADLSRAPDRPQVQFYELYTLRMDMTFHCLQLCLSFYLSITLIGHLPFALHLIRGAQLEY